MPTLMTLAAASAAAALSATPVLAKGGGDGGGGATPPPARCAALTVTNTGQTVRNYAMPDARFTLASCGTEALSVTVTVTETDGFLSVLCPSPVAEPVTLALGAGQKLAGARPVFRGPCGFAGSSSSRIVDSPLGWQGHNLLLTATDDATGAVLGSGFFSWQDARTTV